MLTQADRREMARLEKLKDLQAYRQTLLNREIETETKRHAVEQQIKALNGTIAKPEARQRGAA